MYVLIQNNYTNSSFEVYRLDLVTGNGITTYGQTSNLSTSLQQSMSDVKVTDMVVDQNGDIYLCGYGTSINDTSYWITKILLQNYHIDPSFNIQIYYTNPSVVTVIPES